MSKIIRVKSWDFGGELDGSQKNEISGNIDIYFHIYFHINYDGGAGAEIFRLHVCSARHAQMYNIFFGSFVFWKTIDPTCLAESVVKALEGLRLPCNETGLSMLRHLFTWEFEPNSISAFYSDLLSDNRFLT